MGTAKHILEKLRHIQDLRLYIVYNTPKEMSDIENELGGLKEHCLAESYAEAVKRSASARRIEKSTSKAENLNAIIPELKETYVAIYDADHHPDPDSLALAIQHLKRTGVDCVQGSTYIRDGDWLSWILIHAEFFIGYFVFCPVMERLTGTGFFGGSNAVWRGDAIRTADFDHEMLTEDIDCFLRCATRKDNPLKFNFLPQCRSGELAPSGFRSFWKQRLRWAMGWDEVTLKHIGSIAHGPQGCRAKVGLFYIFVLRWFTLAFSAVVVVWNTLAVLEASGHLDRAHHTPKSVKDLQFISMVFYLSTIVFAFFQALLHEPSPRLLFGILAYFILGTIYLAFQSFTVCTSLLRLMTGRRGGWVVTQRTGTTSLLEPLREEATDKPSGGARCVVYLCAGLPLALVAAVFGGALGLLIGRRLGTSWVHHYSYGWLSWEVFGVGETTEEIVDQRSEFLGAFFGVLLAITVSLLASCYWKVVARRGASSTAVGNV